MRTDTPNAMALPKASATILMSILLVSGGLRAQQVPAPDLSNAFVIAPSADPAIPLEANLEFVCPVDKHARSKEPGFCPRCGMKLLAGLPEPIEYFVGMTTKPRALKAGDPIQFTFRVEHPYTQQLVPGFEIVHEKLHHLFVVVRAKD